MANELPTIDVPDIEFSFPSPVDIVTTLISSVASVHNVNNITRTKYAEIQAALKAYDGILETREKEFANKMLQQKENLDILYRFLEIAIDGAKNSSGENATHCCNIVFGLLDKIEKIYKDGPPIVDVSLKL